MEAFFAADAGLEWALYWDIQRRGDDKFRGSDSTISCLGSSIPVDVTGNRATFDIRDTTLDVCASVEVRINGLETEVFSRGFNTCATSDPGRIERGLRAEYYSYQLLFIVGKV